MNNLNSSLKKLIPFSPILYEHLKSIYMSPQKEASLLYSLSRGKIQSRMTSFLNILEEALELIPLPLKKKIQTYGLDIFKSEINRRIFEFYAFKVESRKVVKKKEDISIKSSFHSLISIHLQEEVSSSLLLKVKGNRSIGLSSLHFLTFEQFTNFYSVIRKYLKNKNKSDPTATKNSLYTTANKATNCFAKMALTDDYINSRYFELSLNKLFTNKDFTIKLAEQTEEGYTSALYNILKNVYPAIYKNQFLTSPKRKIKTYDRLLNGLDNLNLQVLKKQLTTLITRAKTRENTNDYNLPFPVLEKSLNSLIHVLPTVLEFINPAFYKELKTVGLKSLDKKENYQNLEFIAWDINSKASIKTQTKVELAISNIYSMYKNEYLPPYSHFKMTENARVDITRAYALGLDRFNELEGILIDYLKIKFEDSVIENATRDSINKSVNVIQRIFEGDLLLQSQYKDSTIMACLLDKSFTLEASISTGYSSLCSFNHLLKTVLPSVYGPAEKRVFTSKTDMENYIRSISDDFASHINIYIKNRVTTPQQKSDVNSLVKFLYTMRKEASKIIKILSNNGVFSLAENSGEGFKAFNKILIDTGYESKKPLNIALEIYSYLLNPETKVTLRNFNSRTLTFKNLNENKISTIDLSFIYDNYKKLFEEIKNYAYASCNKEDGEARQVITVKTVVISIKYILKNYSSSLSDSQKQLIKKYGFSAFNKNEFEILKIIRYEIYTSTMSNAVTVNYGRLLQLNLDTVLRYYNLEPIKAYRVQKNLNKEEKNSKYTFEEVVKIAFTIESALSEPNISIKKQVFLLAARIILKTGWNATPLLELNNDDLFYLDTSISGNKTAAVRLFKRRANYQTQWHEFNVSSDALEDLATGSKVTPVIRDIEKVTNLTNGLAKTLNSTTLKKRIFAYTYNQRVQLITTSTLNAFINTIFQHHGLNLTFRPKSIRKAGLNYTYRKVANNFKKYRSAGQHSPSTFFKYYFETDKAETNESLSNATSVMADYFVRDITDKVTFVESKPAGAKKTPNGNCIQTRISIDKEICSDFSACLFCEYYRCIADPEHVWRLLSYREQVVNDMDSASASYSDDSIQNIYIKGIKTRVNQILEAMHQMNPDSVTKGQELFETEGSHPDWLNYNLEEQ